MSRKLVLLFLFIFILPLYAEKEMNSSFPKSTQSSSTFQIFTLTLRAHTHIVTKKFFTALLDHDLEEEKELHSLMKTVAARHQNQELGYLTYGFLKLLTWLISAFPTLLLLIFFYVFYLRQKGRKIIYWVSFIFVVFMLLNVGYYRYRQAEANRLIALFYENFTTHPVVDKVKNIYQDAVQVVGDSMAGIQVIKTMEKEFQTLPLQKMKTIQRKARLYAWFSAFSTLMFYVALWSILVVIEWGIFA